MPVGLLWHYQARCWRGMFAEISKRTPLLSSGNSMLVLVSYDVNAEDAKGRKRLRHIARPCENWGQCVQFSVFECLVDPAQWAAFNFFTKW